MDKADAAYIAEISRLTAVAVDDADAACTTLRGHVADALAAGHRERAAVLAAQAVQWQISDFATLAGLRDWSAPLVAAVPALDALERHAALVYCAGAIATHQFADAFAPEVRARLPAIDTCLAHYRARLLDGRDGVLDPNIAVATAEHPASWSSTTGNRGAIDEISVAIEPYLAHPALAPHVRARWLFWLSTMQMLTDQHAVGAATLKRARSGAAWRWLEFHLHRILVRPLLEDGRADAAAEHIQALRGLVDPQRPLDLSDYHHLTGWLAALRDEPRVAAQHYELAIDAARRGALPAHMAALYQGGLAQSLLSAGEEERAEQVYAQMTVLAGPRGETQRVTSIEMARALAARRTGDACYAEHLARALAAAREGGLVRFLRLLPRLAAEVCADALELEIEPAFVLKAIAQRRLAPPPRAGESWPWPIKLYGLRPFNIVIDGEALRFDGKAPAKPLQLLKLLMAQGGAPVAIHQVTDRLWPDLEPGDARRAFDLALHRLRTLLVHRDVLVLAEGRLALDDKIVWLDTRALDTVLRECGDARSTANPGPRKRVFESLVRLYRQPLLLGDDEPWIIGAREPLRHRFLLGVDALARAAERAGERTEPAWMRQWAAPLSAD